MKILKKHKQRRINKRLGQVIEELSYIQKIARGTFGSSHLRFDLAVALSSIHGAVWATHKMIPPNTPAARKRGWHKKGDSK